MELRIQCPICKAGIERKRRNGKEVSPGINYSIFASPESNIIELNCLKHYTIIYLQNLKFDLLFESGIRALKDLYYRESVASAASSLERFYEFCIGVFTIKDIHKENFEKAWNKVSSMSERQLGAFIFLYTTKMNEMPPILSESQSNFRNKVIHKGYFPNELETKKFHKTVFEIITKTCRKLVELDPEAVQLKIEQLELIVKREAELLTESYTVLPNYDPKAHYRVTKYPKRYLVDTFLSGIITEASDYDELDKLLEN